MEIVDITEWPFSDNFTMVTNMTTNTSSDIDGERMMLNTTMTDLYPPDQLPTPPVLPIYMMYVYVIMRSIWAVMSLFGNSLTIAAIISFPVLRKTSNYFICSLAIADIIMAGVTPLELYHELHPDHSQYDLMCKVDKVFNLMSLRGNYFSIFIISVDRLLFIAHPLKYHMFMTTRMTVGIICALWMYMMIENPLVMAFGTNPIPRGICKIAVIIKSNLYYTYLAPQYLIMICLTILMYCIVALIAYKQKRRILSSDLPADSLEANVMKKQNKITKMMMTVLAFFTSSYVVQFVGAGVLRASLNRFSLVAERCTLIIFYINIWINPLIYAWRDREFRNCFNKILRRQNSIVPSQP